MERIPMIVFSNLGLNEYNIYLYTLLCLICTILLACMFKPALDVCWNKLSKKKTVNIYKWILHWSIKWASIWCIDCRSCITRPQYWLRRKRTQGAWRCCCSIWICCSKEWIQNSFVYKIESKRYKCRGEIC